MSDIHERNLRKALKALYDDLIEIENGPDRNTFGFKHRLKVIHENLEEMMPRLLAIFPHLGEFSAFGDFETEYSRRGDSGIHQLLKSEIKKLAIEIDADLEQDYTITESTLTRTSKKDHNNKIENSDSKKGLQFSRAQLIVAIIVGAFVIFGIVWGLLANDNPMNMESISECISGKSGLVYTNCELGFLVERPSIEWEFSDPVDLANVAGFNPETDYILGGIHIGIKREASALILVFSGDDPEKQNLESWAEKMEKFFSETYPFVAIQPDISIEKDRVKITSLVVWQNEPHRAISILEKHDDKFYYFIFTHRDNIPNPERIKSDLDNIIHSFKYIT